MRFYSPKKWMGITLFCLLFPCLLHAKEKAVQVNEVCPGKVEIRGHYKIKLNEIEKKLTCGDPEVEAWKEIPPNQAKFHLGVFLQDRGFHHENFSVENDKLIVELGEPTYIKKVDVRSDPPFKEMPRKRFIVGETLTPKRLNELEEWIKMEVRAKSHPCPQLVTRANTVTGVVEVDLDWGPKQNVISVIQETVPGMDPGALRRYDAFGLDKPFNDDLLELTSRRVEESGVLQSSHFTWPCPSNPEGVDLFQRAFPGKPRLFRIGFGFDTEEYAIFQSSWKHARLGSKASNLSVSLYASYRTQSLEVASDWYPFKPLSSRWYFQPSVNLIHELQPDFHYAATNAFFAAARRYDNQKLGLIALFGPNLNYTYTFSGAEEGLTRFLTLHYELDLKSHDWEYWQKDPRSGFRVLGVGDFGTQTLLSEISAQRFKWDGQYLYNFRGYDLPKIVLGIRGGIYGTFVDQDPDTVDKLPPNYKFYLGGTQNLRGFSLNELPEDGALSALWGGVEIRLAHTLPYWIEPLVFVDAGILGDNVFNYKLPVYYSPGGGVRVASPFGVFRTTFAHGFKSGGEDGNPDNTHFQFLFSFGEEF